MMRRQRGAALVIAVGLLGLLAIAALARALASPPGVANQLATERALARARDALIAYAATEDNSPGALPCPDYDNDGESDGNEPGFVCSHTLGRLPWKTLGIGPVTDGAGECIWYALTPGFSNKIPTSQRTAGSATRPLINPDAPGGISRIDASGAATGTLIAVVIAPGRALDAQVRGAMGDTACRHGEAAQFLDAYVADGVTFRHDSATLAISAPASDTFNDRVLGLGNVEVFRTVGARVLSELASRDGAEPAGSPDWWTRNAWCGHVCSADGTARIALAAGNVVQRVMPALPECVTACATP
jgi:type II secretory pathway pseudopilin PulG